MPPLVAVRGVGVPGAEPAADGGRDMVRSGFPRMDTQCSCRDEERYANAKERKSNERSSERRRNNDREGRTYKSAMAAMSCRK